MATTTPSDDLASILRELGVDITRVGREISGRCPVHAEVTGHADRSPSWSMNATSGLWICYSCGSRGSLNSLVSTITGETDSIELVTRFMIESIDRRLSSPASKKADENDPAPEPDVVSYRDFAPVPSKWLKRRQLDPEVCHAHGVRFDPDDRAWIIPVISPVGELMGWQAKKTGWFSNVPTGINKRETLFGIERFKVGGTGILLESPLDVVRLASVMEGVQGLASFGVHVSVAQRQLLLGYCDRLIVGLDHDKAGTAEAKRLFESRLAPRKGVTFLKYSHTEAKDLGDMDDDELEEAVLKASPVPWWYRR